MKKKKSQTVAIELIEGDEFIGRITIEFTNRKVLARVFSELADTLIANDKLTGQELRGILKVIK